MPHAVILGARVYPTFPALPFAREAGRIHKVVETLRAEHALVLKSILLQKGEPTKLLVRIDQRDDGMVVRLDDHQHVERTPAVFEHLTYLARAVLAANPGATVGPTNLDVVPKQAAGSA